MVSRFRLDNGPALKYLAPAGDMTIPRPATAPWLRSASES